jgi:phosphinothricin acetyltransferase
MKPVEKEEIPHFIEQYAAFAAQQALEAGWFSNEQEALEGILNEEERKLLEVLQDPLSNETFYNSWKNENFLFYIYLDNESIPCGHFWCNLGMPGEKYGYIQSIFIEAEYRGRGIGTAILNALEKELKAQGFKGIDLHVFTHTPAYSLYKKLGYNEFFPGQNGENGVSSWYMVKELNN